MIFLVISLIKISVFLLVLQFTVSKSRKSLNKRLSRHFSIIARTTFAWFTSKDEVTNRLSANADYDVSIVESYAPPKNWTPGQQVNKDVYALNSGTTPAYVNEDVSSKLTYTVEKKIKTWDADCVTLSDDKVDSIKAGAHLAGAFKSDGTAMTAAEIGNKLDPATGDIYEYFNNGDGTNPITTDDYTPTVSGIYVFRRSIGVAADQTETFKYEGFYFDAGTKKYYKLADLKINEKTSGEAGDNIGTDGNLTKVPTVMYAKEDTQTVTPKLKYEPKVGAGTGNADDNHPQRLVATVNTNAGNPTAAQAGAVDSADLAVTGMSGKLKDLNDAEAALNTAYAAYVAAGDAYNAALTTIDYYAGETNDDSITNVSFTYVTNTTEPSDNVAALTNTSIVAPGILRSEIDEYNTLLATFNGLASQITSAGTAVTNANGELSTANTGVTNAQSTFDNAKAAYTAALPGHTYEDDIATIGTPSTSDTIYTVWAAEQALKAAKTTQAEKQAAYDAAVANRDALTAQKENLRNKLVALAATIDTNVTALNAAINERDTNAATAAGNGASPNDYNAKKTAYEDALAAYNDALKAYNDARAEYEAAEHEGHDITIYINLSDDVVTTGNTAADKWQLIPIVAGNAASDETAHFYYTGILEGGESSAKLIDSVYLADSVTQDAYKNFDFDLNINLDSVQVVYEDDQKTLSTDPVTGEAAKFESRSANLTNPTSLDTPVLWN